MTLDESFKTKLIPCLSNVREIIITKHHNEDGSINRSFRHLLPMLEGIYRLLESLGYHCSVSQCTSFFSRPAVLGTTGIPGEAKMLISSTDIPLPVDQKGYLLELRNNLLRLIGDPVFTRINPEALLDIHAVLLSLAEEQPINEDSFITLEPMKPAPNESIVYTSDGYQFNILEIIEFNLKKHKLLNPFTKFNLEKHKFLNPYTNGMFSSLDICHLLNTTILFSRKHPENYLLNKFLTGLGCLNGSHCRNNIVFLLNEKELPSRIYKPSIMALGFTDDKATLICNSSNIIEALYNNDLCLKEIENISQENLELIHYFRKTITLLRGPNRSIFVSELQSTSHLELFKKLNSTHFDLKEHETCPAPP